MSIGIDRRLILRTLALAALIAATEIILGLGPGHFAARERAEPDAFLTFRLWLIPFLSAGGILMARTWRAVPAAALLANGFFVFLAGLGEWLALAAVGEPEPAIMIRAALLSLLAGLGVTAAGMGFVSAFRGRALAAVALLLFCFGVLAIRPPLPSIVSWFEHRLRPTPTESARPRLHVALFTALPLVWGEGAALDAVSGRSRAAAVYTDLSTRFQMTPIDSFTPSELKTFDVLMLAQPPALHPRELVALDGWIRDGGRALIFVDPQLHWARDEALRGRTLPSSNMIEPLLDHWGLSLDPGIEGGKYLYADRTELFGAGRIGVVDPGVLRTKSDSCRLDPDHFSADCRIGRGRAIIVADADILRDRAWVGPGPAGASRALRLADNAGFVAGTLWNLMGLRPAGVGNDVRWMQAPATESVMSMLAIGLSPMIIAALISAGLRKNCRLRRFWPG